MEIIVYGGLKFFFLQSAWGKPCASNLRRESQRVWWIYPGSSQSSDGITWIHQIAAHKNILSIERSSCSLETPTWLAMNGENRPLVTDDPVEVEEKLVKVSRLKENYSSFTKIYKIYLKLMKTNQKVSTCIRLDFETLGSRPILPKFSPDTGGLRLTRVLSRL